MSEALNAFEIEGQNSTVNVIDILDYLSFATAQVRTYYKIEKNL